MRKSHVSQSNWEEELTEFLRQYRATPHSTTNKTPHSLLFRTESSTSRLPNILREPLLREAYGPPTALQALDATKKEKMKQHADKNQHTRHSRLCIGDMVVAQQIRQHKAVAEYDEEPYRIVEINGNQATIANAKGKWCRKNVAHLKLALSATPVDAFGARPTPAKKTPAPRSSAILETDIFLDLLDTLEEREESEVVHNASEESIAVGAESAQSAEQPESDGIADDAAAAASDDNDADIQVGDEELSGASDENASGFLGGPIADAATTGESRDVALGDAATDTASFAVVTTATTSSLAPTSPSARRSTRHITPVTHFGDPVSHQGVKGSTKLYTIAPCDFKSLEEM